jgi:hypothetical protein
MELALRAQRRAASLRTIPRATFSIFAVLFIRLNPFSLIKSKVEAMSGVWMVRKSANGRQDARFGRRETEALAVISGDA